MFNGSLIGDNRYPCCSKGNFCSSVRLLKNRDLDLFLKKTKWEHVSFYLYIETLCGLQQMCNVIQLGDEFDENGLGILPMEWGNKYKNVFSNCWDQKVHVQKNLHKKLFT